MSRLVITRVEDSVRLHFIHGVHGKVFDWPQMSESALTGHGDPSHQSDRITLGLIGGNKKPNELIPLVKGLHIEGR
jgi:hypothetical protein